MEYSANFLFGFDDNSIESIGYEFANAKTEEYQKECWEAIKQYFNQEKEKYIHMENQVVELLSVSRCKNIIEVIQLFKK
jgi:hypothetical protein